MTPEAYLLLWIFCAILGGAIGHTKNRLAQGVILGALLGVIGPIIVLCLSKKAETKDES